MTATRYLIVNADDFGLSPGVNRGIIEAHEHGIVTSTSLMVRWPAAEEAAAYARTHHSIGIGLHLDLGEWAYRDDRWVCLYEVVRTDDARAVAEEATRQLESFRGLMRQGPTHLDSHQHVHREEPVRGILLRMAHDLGVPLRHFSPEVSYCGDFYGQTGKGLPWPEAISVESLLGILTTLPPGVTELACHPGSGDDLDSMYRAERAQEVRTLCDPGVRAALADAGIALRSFRSMPRGGGAGGELSCD
jgi:predicted glycoside hydrolase/deacetylase ChbG (UPF0249 family)